MNLSSEFSIPPFHCPGAHGFQPAGGLVGCGAGATRPGNGAAGDKQGKRFISPKTKIRTPRIGGL